MIRHYKLTGLLAILLLILCSTVPGQTIQQRIDTIFARPDLAGNTWTGLAVSEDGTLTHYTNQPDTTQIPASNAKLTTTAAAFALLGPNHAFESRVYANGTITGGVLTGDLNLVVEHDITWATTYFSNARTPLNHIATRVRTIAGITRVTGTVRVYGASVYNHGQFDSLGSQTQTTRNSNSATAFRDALIANGVAVDGSSAGLTGFTAPGTVVYTHKSSDVGSYNLERACRPLNKISINPAADMLLRHIGYKMNGNSASSDTYAAGRVQVEAWLGSAAVPVNATGFVQADGSGLSYSNRQSGRHLVDLLRYMRTAYPTFDDTLTIACTDGTLGGRLCGTDTTGRVHGKTGSLNVTIAVSGYVRNRHINQRVYFSFIHNRSGGINQSATRTAIDDAIRVLAGADVPIFNLPPAPDFYTLRAAGNPPNLLLQWSTVSGASGYRIYRSIDGGAFSFHRQVSGSTLLALEPTLDTALYAYRVSTVNGDGEGPGSNALVARINAPGPLVLMTRGSIETEPDPTQPIPPSMQALTNALDTDIRIEMASATRVGGGQVDLTRFDAVLWYFDHDKPSTHTLSTQERTVVTSYLAGGGALMISGSKLATNLDSDFGGTTATDAFLNDVLCHRAQSLSAGVNFVNSFQSVLFEGISATTLGDCDLAGFPMDVVEPAEGARRELLYQPGAVGGAAISADVGCRLVVFPVPFDCIPSVERRALYMERIMSFLVPPPVVVLSDFLTIH